MTVRVLKRVCLVVMVAMLVLPATLAFAQTGQLLANPRDEFSFDSTFDVKNEGVGALDSEEVVDGEDEQEPIIEDGDEGEPSDKLEIGIRAASAPIGAGPVASIPNGRYLLRPLISGTRVLEIAGGSTANNARVQLFTSKMSMNQWFDITYVPETGLYTIQNVKSGKYLEVESRPAKSGSHIWQRSKSTSLGQQWYIVADAANPGSYRIINGLSKIDPNATVAPGEVPPFSVAYTIGVRNAVNSDKARVNVAKPNGTKAQVFAFIPWDAGIAPSTASVADGMYTITTNLAGSPVLEIRGASEVSGAKLQINTTKNTLEQTFMVKKESDGFHSIRPMHSALALAVPKGNKVTGIEIKQEPLKAVVEQRWSIRENTDGTVSIFSKASGLPLSVKNGSNQSGTVVRQAHYSGSSAQRFILKAPSTNAISVGNMLIIPRSQSSKRVEVAGASRTSGANIQASKSDSSFSQKFQVKRVSTGVNAFQSVQSGHYITAKGNTVVQEPGVDGEPTTRQQWRVERTFKGYTIINVETGQAMELTIGGTGGHDIRLATPSGTNAQLFKFKATTLIPKHQINVLNSSTGLRLKSAAAKTAHGTPISMVTKSATSNAQKWRLQKVTGEYFTIKCVRSGRVVGVVGNSTKDGTAVQLLNNKKSAGQLWRFVPSGDGWFYLQSSNGMYLSADSVSGSRVSATTTIHQYTQKFRFAPTTYTPPSPYIGTYIDVNLSTQKLMYIVNGYPQLTTDVVTGKPSTPTPAGTFYVLYKQSPAVLVGADYAAPVSFWMPFTSVGHGFHDANWQPWFGGNRWTYAGSHGCVNMPYWAAAQLYSLAPAGSRVSIHW